MKNGILFIHNDLCEAFGLGSPECKQDAWRPVTARPNPIRPNMERHIPGLGERGL